MLFCSVFRKKSEVPVVEEESKVEYIEKPLKNEMNYFNSYKKVNSEKHHSSLNSQEEIIYDQSGHNIPATKTRYLQEAYPATDGFSDSSDSYAFDKGYKTHYMDDDESIHPQLYNGYYNSLPYRKKNSLRADSSAEMEDPYYYGYKSYGKPRSFRKFQQKPPRHVYRTYPKPMKSYEQVYNPLNGYDSERMKYY